MKKIGGEYEGVFICDAGGNAYVDGLGGKYKGLALADRDYIKEAIAGKANIGQVTKSRATGKPIIPIAAPIYRGNDLVGVVASILKADFLMEKVASIKIGDTGYPSG
jgi:methyl-accepting chemotaxis protein